MSHHNGHSQGAQDTLTRDEQTLKAHLSSHLDAQADALDYNVTSKLSAARHRALAGEQAGDSNWLAGISWNIVARGTVAVAFLAFMINQMIVDDTTPSAPQVAEVETQTQPVITTTANIIEDLHLLSATDDIDFYQSVEFLEWMEMNSG